MNSKRFYFILVATVALLVAGLAGGAYGATLVLQGEADALLQARSKSMALEAQQLKLVKAKNDILKYKTLGDIAKSIVPQDKDQAQTVREIVNIANANGVKLGGISFPVSTLGSTVPKAGAAATAPAAKPTPAAAGAPNLTQLKPATGIPGVYELAITVSSDTAAPADYDKVIGFLNGLESNRRTAIVSGINLTPDSKDPTRVSFTLNINEYIKP
jgi:hypothetical protein